MTKPVPALPVLLAFMRAAILRHRELRLHELHPDSLSELEMGGGILLSNDRWMLTFAQTNNSI